MSDIKDILPDFDYMFDLVKKIRELSFKKMMLTIDIKTDEAMIVNKAMNDSKYFINGKPPSFAFVDATYKWTGFDYDLIEKREELARISADLDEAENNLRICRDMISLYQTESANKRATLV